MGFIGVSLCDMCGKRTEIFAGRLILFKEVKHNRDMPPSQVTARSWRVCKLCLSKLTAIQTDGDKIKEELEIKLDQIRGTKEIKLLEMK